MTAKEIIEIIKRTGCDGMIIRETIYYYGHDKNGKFFERTLPIDSEEEAIKLRKHYNSYN